MSQSSYTKGKKKVGEDESKYMYGRWERKVVREVRRGRSGGDTRYTETFALHSFSLGTLTGVGSLFL